MGVWMRTKDIGDLGLRGMKTGLLEVLYQSSFQISDPPKIRRTLRESGRDISSCQHSASGNCYGKYTSRRLKPQVFPEKQPVIGSCPGL
jgi:hypothetical protein